MIKNMYDEERREKEQAIFSGCVVCASCVPLFSSFFEQFSFLSVVLFFVSSVLIPSF